MKSLITPAQMRDMEGRYFAGTGTPSIELMERAARALNVAIARHYKLERAVYFACGPGGNGGDGWLRLIEFTPDMKHAKAYTYSPYFAQDPETAEKAFETSPINAFEFEIE